MSSPVASMYGGVVSRDSVSIASTYAALNSLDVCAADIQNAYLPVPSSQEHYIDCGPTFGLENAGKAALLHQAPYGAKMAGLNFCNHLRTCMRHLVFQSCPGIPYVWMHPAQGCGGGEFYEYILLYMDDALSIGKFLGKCYGMSLANTFCSRNQALDP